MANIDEGFYSRQLYVLGHEAMRRMGTASVLIAGMRGLGVEIAKNVILSGVKSVTIQDEGVTQWTDLSSQFFLNESSIGQNRALCSLQQLRALNPHVQVKEHTGPLGQELLLQFQVVVLTDSSLDDQKRFGDFCHLNGIHFIVADTKGLCGQLFCDFGEAFEVLDQDGEMPESVLIQKVSQGNPGVVICSDDQRHGFTDGSKVIFSEVQGMTELNSLGPVQIKERGSCSFSICDTSSFSEYERGGIVTEVKQPCTIYFKSLSQTLTLDLELLITNDFGKIDRHKTLHLAFQALHGFVGKEKRLPRPHCQSDADMILDAVRKLNEDVKLEKLDEVAVKKFSFTAQGNLAPLCAFIGGLAAQEVIKACSRKFTPLKQWFYFDALESLPEDDNQVEESLFSLKGTRYDGQIAVFGSDFQEKLERQKYFLVGAGAIGCELLKNFALIGLGAGEGHITVTDMDHIEKSNLNRQFLFRSQDIGKPKSEVAARAVKAMNPQMNITAHQNRLATESEQVYDYHFFSGLDGAAAALDNVEARAYLDSCCVVHNKPMLEGGTLGSKGHTLVVVPRLTESYGPAKSSSKNEIPLCTLKNFPHRIEHTLQWARDQFEGLFKQSPENVMMYLRDEDFITRTLGRGEVEALQVFTEVWSSLMELSSGGRRPVHWEDCVQWARVQWETLFNNDIRQLLYCFPPHEVTSHGLPFWSGTKRCPHPLTFDPTNVTHMDYIVAAANLYGQTYGISGTRDRALISEILERVTVPEFTPQSLKIPVTDEEMEERESDEADKEKLEELKQKLSCPSLKSSMIEMFPMDFEKDDDSNFHMDYITAASNLRAENYNIPAVDRLESKRIAGRIIPAIATTTAAVSGLMCLELYKLVQGHQNIRSYRTAFVNLAVMYFVLSLPSRAKPFTVAGKSFTLWDNFLVEGRCSGGQEMTLERLIQFVKEKCDLEVCSLFYGSSIIYNGQKDRLQKTVSELIKMVTKAEIPPYKKMLELFPSFTEDENCEVVPCIQYLLL
ncbi:ubiquitin-like modifier-activating enzyme 1 [Periophthalmus magnuspinnatus]|uniref:ubiquitin-like modifier-activating enzyme 1 n=1 Tax=Periophthalmus magnuspinnatus TaxID=409849 RepID=UPI00145B7E26|nr:ubiquitin-like modifier-activating enzyme 1 [Periophthalmus magnuspinnatus]